MRLCTRPLSTGLTGPWSRGSRPWSLHERGEEPPDVAEALGDDVPDGLHDVGGPLRARDDRIDDEAEQQPDQDLLDVPRHLISSGCGHTEGTGPPSIMAES